MLNLASDLRSRVEAALEHRIPHALTPIQRTTPELMPTGIGSVDTLTGGIPLGCLTEICGTESSGRTSVLMAIIAQSMRRGEICALVDASDAFDPQSATNAGVELEKLLWVRCGRVNLDDSTRSARIESALKCTDLLLQAGGFGLVVLDLADTPVSAARRIPLTTWFRFRRAVEHTKTALVVLEEQPHAKSCASLVMEFTVAQSTWTEAAEQRGTIIGVHGDALEGVSFRVTSQGVAVPFERPASSFETPQRWNTPRLLSAMHVHLQVTRSRGLREMQKFPAQSERVHSQLLSCSASEPLAGLEA